MAVEMVTADDTENYSSSARAFCSLSPTLRNIGRTAVEAEAPILWPPNVKS